MSTSGSTIRSPNSVPQDQVDPTAKDSRTPRMGTRSRSLSRGTTTRAPSAGVKVVGPAKRRIRSKATEALKLLNKTEKMVTHYQNKPEEISPENLKKVDKHLLDAQKSALDLQNLESFIEGKLDLPEIKNSPQKEVIRADIQKVYEEVLVEDLMDNLSDAIATLVKLWVDRGHNLTRLVPETVEFTDDENEEPAKKATESGAEIAQHPLRQNNGSVSSSLSHPVSGLSEMLYDDTPSETVVSLIGQRNRELQAEINELKEQAVAKEAAHKQALEEQAAALSVNVVRNSSLASELRLLKQNAEQKHNSENGANATGSPKVMIKESLWKPETKVSGSATHNDFSVSAAALKRQALAGVAPVFQAAYPISREKETSQGQPIPAKPAISASNEQLFSELMNAIKKISRDQAEAKAQQDKINVQMSESNKKMVQEIGSWVGNELARHSQMLEAKENAKKQADEEDESDSEYTKIFENPSGEQESCDENSGSEYHPLDRHHKPSKMTNVHTLETTSANLKLSTVLKLLPTFDGSDNWEEFRDTFYQDIISRDDLNAGQKMNILKNHLTNEAKRCVVTGKNPAVAIEKTFESIKAVFGEANTKNRLFRKFSKIPFDQNDPDKMRLNIADINGIRSQIDDLGISANDDRITKVLASKLPPSMRRSTLKMMHREGDKVTLDQILKHINKDISFTELEQEVGEIAGQAPANEIPDFASINHYAASAPPSADHKHKKTSNKAVDKTPIYDPSKIKEFFVDPVTKEKLPGCYAPGEKCTVNLDAFHRTFPFENDEDVKCTGCKGPHNALRCKDSSSEFRKKIAAEGRCAICLSTKHAIKDCKMWFSCIYCGGMHHPGGCPKKEHYRDLKNYPKNAKKRQTFFRPKRSAK